MARQVPLAELRALFRNRPAFARVFAADLASQFGDAGLFLVYPLLILEKTHDASLTGLSFSGEIFALAVLSPLAGWVADRLAPKRVMMAAHLTRLALFVLLSVVLARGPSLGGLLVLSIALGAAGAFFGPARAALLRRLLEAEVLESALALEGTVSFLTRLLAPALMGALLVRFSATVGLWVDMACYAVALALLAPRWVRAGGASRLEAPEGGWREGWRAILATPMLREMLALDVVLTVAGMAAFSLSVALLAQDLRLPAANNGWLMAVTGLSGALGSQLAGWLKRQSWGMTALTMVLAACYLVVPTVRSLEGLLVVWALRGCAVGAAGVMINQRMAAHTAPQVMGRVHAAWGVAVYLAAFLGSVASPALVRTFGAGRSYALLGALVLALLAVLKAGRWARAASRILRPRRAFG